MQKANFLIMLLIFGSNVVNANLFEAYRRRILALGRVRSPAGSVQEEPTGDAHALAVTTAQTTENQCGPCRKPPGYSGCFQYDRTRMAATVDEAMANFQDLSDENSSPLIVADDAGSSVQCTTNECRSCAANLLAKRRTELQSMGANVDALMRQFNATMLDAFRYPCAKFRLVDTTASSKPKPDTDVDLDAVSVQIEHALGAATLNGTHTPLYASTVRPPFTITPGRGRIPIVTPKTPVFSWPVGFGNYSLQQYRQKLESMSQENSLSSPSKTTQGPTTVSTFAASTTKPDRTTLERLQHWSNSATTKLYPITTDQWQSTTSNYEQTTQQANGFEASTTHGKDDKAVKEHEDQREFGQTQQIKHRTKRSTRSDVGRVYPMNMIERGQPDNSLSELSILCTEQWQWRVLSADYFPRYINELACTTNAACLSGYGQCEQRYQSLTILHNVNPHGTPQWVVETLQSPTCCDCKVHRSSPLHAFIAG